MITTVDDSNFRPMLAVPCALNSEIEYPVLMTPKLDGIRCITRTKKEKELFDSPVKCQAVSRYLLPIPNGYIQDLISTVCPPGLDGELITYNNGVAKAYNPVQSDVMSGAGNPDFVYHVFDFVADGIYVERANHARKIVEDLNMPWIQFVPTTYIPDAESLEAYEQKCIADGYEGAIYRVGHSPYKFGRSTWRQQWMIKLKRFRDTEAKVVGFEELMHNDNEASLDSRGYTKRTSHKANLRPSGKLGALICSWMGGTGNSITFRIGTGFTDAQRVEIWEHQNDYIGRLAKFKHQPHGQKEAPRSPVFLGWRHELDTDARPLEGSEEILGD